MVKVPNEPRKIALYDCLVPYIKVDSIFNDFNFKFPMFLIAFAVVIVYQIYKKKKPNNIDDDGSLAAQFAKRG